MVGYLSCTAEFVSAAGLAVNVWAFLCDSLTEGPREQDGRVRMVLSLRMG